MSSHPEPEEPPYIPDNLEDLDRAIMLLGNRTKSPALRPKTERALRELVGTVPSPERAAAFKAYLRQVRKVYLEES